MSNVNVINKAEKDLLKSGETFKVNKVECIVLEQLGRNQTAVIRKELLEDKKKFDSNNNNWRISSIRGFLNGEYLEEIENVFGKDRIVEHTVDLLSLDGLDDYGTSNDKVSLLTIDQYRKYRKVLGENLDNLWWLLTPNSTLRGIRPAMFGASTPMALWATATVTMAGVCVRFSSFNLKYLNLATNYRVAEEQALPSNAVAC